jgi:hypothetical protein
MDEHTAYDIGIEAYTYLYPLVLMDVTRRQAINVEQAGRVVGRGPANAFTHVRAFPPADFRDVVRPNFDTLYSVAWLELSEEPMVVSVPEAGDRYYLLPLYDMWTEIFAVPGTRTTGPGAEDFALVYRGWRGELPEGVQRIDAPTPLVWIIGRTQCNGPADYEAVHRFQDGLKLTPLSQWGKTVRPVTGTKDPTVDDSTPPLRQVDTMTPADFFAYAGELMRTHPPHFNDYPILARMKRIGLVPGQDFDLNAAVPVVNAALEKAVPAARTRIHERQKTLGRQRNGWLMNTETMGTWGTDYLKRATVALIGLGANLPEDAIYPMTLIDADGQPLTGANRYRLHFDKDELPPALAFWSVTLYDNEGFQVANPSNRFAIGDRDPLTYNADGSLDLHIQPDSPGSDKESNWLPAPAGPFNLTMRLYYPKPAALDGTWAPPAVQRVS